MPRPSSPREKMRASESIEDNGLFADITLKDHSEILDATLLHPGVWSKLLELFQLHYSAELLFLHPPTWLQLPIYTGSGMFSSQARTAPIYNYDGTYDGTIAPPSESRLVMIGILCLTARFHEELIYRHSPPSSVRHSNSIEASEYYACALSDLLFRQQRLEKQSIERVQALLMLSLYEWGMCRGLKAWLYVGMATRLAQAMGLAVDQDLDTTPGSLGPALQAEEQNAGIRHLNGRTQTSYTTTELEIRRRTLWSCYIIDTYLSGGKNRTQMLGVKDLKIRLPCSHRAFIFGESVETGLLEEQLLQATGSDHVRDARSSRGTPSKATDGGRRLRKGDNDDCWKSSEGDNVLSRVVHIIQIWRGVSKWTCDGGRRVERYPPWDERCTFHRLDQSLRHFHSSLPRHLQYSFTNLSAHATSNTSTPYTLMHVIYLLSVLILNRDYLPFIPVRCSKPMGPLDPPLFLGPEYTTPPSFWEDSARDLARAARKIVDLLRWCRDLNMLPETPMIGFALYNVGFMGIYCLNFPSMDPEGYISAKSYSTTSAHQRVGESSGGAQAAQDALDMIRNMRSRLRMASGWFKTLGFVQNYYARLVQDYHRNTTNGQHRKEGSVSGAFSCLVREGGPGGGLGEFELFERVLIDFGKLEDADDYDLEDSTGDEYIPPEKVGNVGTSRGIRTENAARMTFPPTEWSKTPENAIMECHSGGKGTGAPGLEKAASKKTSSAHPHPQNAPCRDYSDIILRPQILSPSIQELCNPGLATPRERQHGPIPSSPDAPPIEVPFQGCGDTYLVSRPPPTEQSSQHLEWNPETEVQPSPMGFENLSSNLSGNDIAAFVDGSTWEEWDALNYNRNDKQNWLQMAWGRPLG